MVVLLSTQSSLGLTGDLFQNANSSTLMEIGKIDHYTEQNAFADHSSTLALHRI
jgi:hypothetical protein